MATSQINEVVQYLRSATLLRDGAGLTDEQLLGCFVAQRDEAAFAMLVRRHGPMVWGVCRRVLRDHHDAEDAFQATFLVLTRKAAVIAKRELLANWLYGVAYNTAIKARALTARRRLKEKQVKEIPDAAARTQDLWNDLLPLLDQELSRLPEKYRVPIVLCELEGKSRKEAALQLDVPEGTVASRLARARSKLAKRLAQRGVSLPGGLLAGLLSVKAASACVPTSLVVSTVKAASLFAAGKTTASSLISAHVITLTEGMLKAMLISKLKSATALLLTVGMLCGAGLFMHRALGEKPTKQAVKEKPKEQSREGTTELTGVVQSIDAANYTLTLAGKALGTKTFDVARDAKIYLDDGSGGRLGFKDGKLTDIAEGYTVTLRLSDDRSKVIGIFAEGSNIRGILKAVALAPRTITVTIADKKSDPGQDKTFPVAKSTTVIILDGKSKDKSSIGESKLEDLPIGAVVNLKLSADQKVVSNIQAEGPEIQGIVKAVDGAQNTITVNVNDGTQAVDKTFRVLSTTSIAISDGRDTGKKTSGSSKLTDLPVGAQVTLKLSPDQKSVLSVSARGESISGTVKAVDAARNSLTLSYARGKSEPTEERAFDVPKGASVRIDGKEGKLSDLPTEAAVTVNLAPDQKTVTSLQADGKNVYGAVNAVNAVQGSITLANKGGEQTYAVKQNVPVTIDGKPGKLANVPVDAMATEKLTVDQKEVVSLGVSGPSIQGVLKGVDASKGKITVAVPVSKVDTEEKVFDVVKDVRVMTGKYSVPLKLTDLKGERAVVLMLSADQLAVVQITVAAE